jgi:methionyl-tRNA formyltransferase
VAAAIRDGASETGVTIFVMDEELDHGPVVASRALPLTGDETTDEVTKALSEAAADLLIRTLPDYLAGALEPRPQDHGAATYVPRLRKEDGAIPWAKPAKDVRNHVRSVTSWPGAQTAWQPKVKHDPLPVVVLATQAIEAPASPSGPAKPGTVLAASAAGIDVACGEGALRVLSLKPAGGRALEAAAFLNGHRVVAGDRFL